MSDSNIATFTCMDDGTAEDWRRFYAVKQVGREQLPGRLLSMLGQLEDKPDGSPINGYAHSLQTATLAYRDDADDETVFMALFHDIGQLLSEENHAAVSAAVLKPYLCEKNHWVVKHHAVFQMYHYGAAAGLDHNARELYRGEPHFQACADFCEKYDQRAFDRNFSNKPLEFFAPLVERMVNIHPAD